MTSKTWEGTPLLNGATSPLPKDSAAGVVEQPASGLTVFVTGGSGYVGRNLVRYLVSKGCKVYALARSSKSISTVEKCGAIGVKGDLDSTQAMTDCIKNNHCTVFFHCATYTLHWGPLKKALEVAKSGTANVIQACLDAGPNVVKKFIHVSTSSIFDTGRVTLVNINESYPIPPDSFGTYGMSKREAELTALSYNNINNYLKVIVVRPRLVWGNDDTRALQGFIDAVDSGVMAWLDGGMYDTSTVHATNLAHAMYTIAVYGENNDDEKQPEKQMMDLGGKVYFVTDDEPNPVKFKPFVSDMLACAGVKAPDKVQSFNQLWCLAGVLECLFCCGKSQCCNCFFACCCQCDECCKPPVTREELLSVGKTCTVDGALIRKELGYKPVVSMKDGLIGLAKHFGKSDDEIQKMTFSCLQ